MWTCQTTEHFSTLHQSILGEPGPREANRVSECFWQLSLCIVVITCTYRCSDKLYCLRIVFWSVPEPMWWSFTLWCWVVMQCHKRDQGHGHSQLVFGNCHLHAEISPDFLTFLIILWTVNDEIPKFLATVCWKTLFLNCLTKFADTVFHKVVYLAPSFLVNDHAF